MTVQVGDWVRFLDDQGVDRVAIIIAVDVPGQFQYATDRGYLYDNFILEVRPPVKDDI